MPYLISISRKGKSPVALTLSAPGGSSTYDASDRCEQPPSPVSDASLPGNWHLSSTADEKTLASEKATGSVAKANVSGVSSTECRTWSSRGCRHRANCRTPWRSISDIVSLRRGLCNLSAVRLSNRNTEASCHFSRPDQSQSRQRQRYKHQHLLALNTTNNSLK